MNRRGFFGTLAAVFMAQKVKVEAPTLTIKSVPTPIKVKLYDGLIYCQTSYISGWPEKNDKDN